jgi:hypothetical protein
VFDYRIAADTLLTGKIEVKETNMLSDDVRGRVIRQVQTFTDAYRTSKEVGYNVQGMSLPTFESQEDFDLCRPSEKGTDFRQHNEFIAEVLKGLVANRVPSAPVVFRYPELSKWLNGKPITPESRSAYAAYLGAEESRKKNKTEGK